MSKAKRKIKSMVINLISGKTRRIIKAEVADIQEQYTLGGGAGRCVDNAIRPTIYR